MSRKFDVVLWGATGFTGKLAAEYLSQHYNQRGGQALRWALAGRNQEKLETVRKSLENPDNVEIVVASIDDPESMKCMAARTKVIIATAGPFDKIGLPVVDACIASSTHYVDITGEATFIRKVIDKYHNEAVEKKLKIVPCCGFDCVPVDMGCFVMVEEMKRRNLAPAKLQTTLISMEGGASGGTINSIINMLDTCSIPQLLAMLNPYFLCPPKEGGGNDEPCATTKYAASDRSLPYYDNLIKKWCSPFIMQAIDTRVINRSNALKGWQYGKNFVYTESMAVPNAFFAVISSFAIPLVGALLYFRVTRYILKLFLPDAGEGPSKDQREKGYFYFHMHGKGHHLQTGDEQTVCGTINAPHGDGGYKQTSRMVCEAGICLALSKDDPSDSNALYGVLTPSTALGKPFLRRLEDSPGISFLTE